MPKRNRKPPTPPPPLEMPPEISVIESDTDTAQFIFPHRQLGWLRLAGLVFIGLGAALLYWVVRMGIADWRPQNKPVAVEDFVMLGLGVVIGSFAYFPLWLGLSILAGRREVTLRGGKLRTTECVGPFWRTKRWPLGKLSRLQVVAFFPADAANPKEGSLLSRLDALSGMLEDGTRFMIVPAYPRRLLNPFAEELARRCNCKFDRAEYVSPAMAETRAQATVLTAWNEGVRHQPESSRAIVDDAPGGITIALPRYGFRGGPLTMIVLGGVASAVAGFVMAKVDNLPTTPTIIVQAIGFAGLLVAIHGIRIARRKAVIAVVGRQLLVMQTGLVRSTERSWEADQLAAVRVGKSGMQINEVDILELQIVPKEGLPFGLLAGRDEPEIAWIAGVVRERLGLPAG
jgi:hypothetical protein